MLVYDMALALQREEHYPFPQWGIDHAPPGRRNESDIHASLLIEDKTAVGTAAFSYRQWTGPPSAWHMNFVLLTHSYRRKGVLSRRWPEWVKHYGKFTFEFPISYPHRGFPAGRLIGHTQGADFPAEGSNPANFRNRAVLLLSRCSVQPVWRASSAGVSPWVEHKSKATEIPTHASRGSRALLMNSSTHFKMYRR